MHVRKCNYDLGKHYDDGLIERPQRETVVGLVFDGTSKMTVQSVARVCMIWNDVMLTKWPFLVVYGSKVAFYL